MRILDIDTSYDQTHYIETPAFEIRLRLMFNRFADDWSLTAWLGADFANPFMRGVRATQGINLAASFSSEIEVWRFDDQLYIMPPDQRYTLLPRLLDELS